MRILVLTRGCWDKSNNTGNTMDNFFGSFKDAEIHNLYFRSEIPKNNPCKTIFQISEQQLIKNILKRKSCGKRVENSETNDDSAQKEAQMYSSAKKTNLTILSYARELVWMMGKWKNSQLDEYLAEVDPEIVFMPVYNCWYPHKVLRYIKKRTNAKVVLFHADDNYTLKQHSFSPLYWMYRFSLRKWVRRSEKLSLFAYSAQSASWSSHIRCFLSGASLGSSIPQITKVSSPYVASTISPSRTVIP